MGIRAIRVAVFCFGTALECRYGAAQDFASLAQQAAAARANDPAQAATLYRQAVNLRPEWAEGWFYLGTTLFDSNQFSASEQALTQAAKLAPQRGTVWAFLGLAEERAGHIAQALTDLEKGERIGLADNPSFVSAVRNTTAEICIRKGDFTGAGLQLRDLARVEDHSERTIGNLGLTVLSLPLSAPKTPMVQAAGDAAWSLYARQTDAAKKIEAFAADYPAEPGAHYLYGIYLLDSDKTAARAEFERVLHLDSSNSAAHLQLGILDLREAQPAAAEKHARRAIQSDVQNALAQLILGRALLDQKNPAAAVHPLQTAAELAPENAEAHYFLGQAYKRLNKPEDARREFSEFSRLKTNGGSPLPSTFAQP